MVTAMETEKKYRKLFQTILISGLAFVINCGINMVLTPYIIEHVGAEAYGFVALSKQFAQYAAIVTISLNSFAVRYIVVAYHNNRMKESNTYFSSVFYGDMVLATVIVLISVGVIAFLDKILNIPANIVWDVKALFGFAFINFWVVTVFSVYGSAAYVKNKLDVMGIFKGFSYVTEAIVLLIMYMVFPAKVFFVGIGLLAASLVVAGSNCWICRRYTPELKICRKQVSLAEIRRLVMDGIWSSVNEMGEMLNSGLDLIICNLMLNSLEMGQLAVAKMVGAIFASVFTLVAQPFQPVFLKSYASGDKRKLLEDLKFSMKVTGLLASIAFAGFTALGMSFNKLWIPGQDIRRIYFLMLLTIAIWIPGGPMKPLYYIYVLTVKKKIPSIVTIVSGLVNVAGMYVLLRFTDLGVYAIALTTAIVMCIINFLINPLYMAYVLRLPKFVFIPGVFRNLTGCVILVVVFKWLAHWYLPQSWITLAVTSVGYLLVGMIIYIPVVCEKDDWRKIVNVIQGRRRHGV